MREEEEKYLKKKMRNYKKISFFCVCFGLLTKKIKFKKKSK